MPHYSNDCPWALLMVIANRTFPVSPSSFIYPPVPPGVLVVVVSLCPGRHFCPGRHLCSGVPVCNFSLSALVVIYIPRVPVVICVPVLWWWWLLIEHSLCPGRFLFECPGRHLYSLCPGRHLCPDVPVCNFVSRQTWRQSTHKHDVTRQTHRQLIFIYLDLGIYFSSTYQLPNWFDERLTSGWQGSQSSNEKY